MKKILFIILSMSVTFYAKAQTDDVTVARQLVSKTGEALGFSKDDPDNYIVSSSYLDKETGIRMVYLIQSYKGLPVYNQMLVLAYKNEKLISKAGNFNFSIEKLVNTKSAIPVIAATIAVNTALSDRKLATSKMPVIINTNEKGQKIEFNDMGISRENITAELMWVPVEKSNQYRLAWQIYIIPNSTSDYWLVRIDATDNTTLGMDNLTAYDNWDHPAEDHFSNTSSVSSKELPELYYAINNLFDFKTISKHEQQLNNSPLLISGATYRVIPFPAESPIHPGGNAALRTDPWTAAPGNATSLKWHTGLTATDYNYTRGNNVWAYQDQPNDNAGSIAESANSTTTPDPLTFDFVPNFTVAPIQTTPVQNQQFNITNLFYWNNVIHDVMYEYGFNEVSGNFQDDNQGRGGAGNDHVNAEAQDGGGTNNANFATPVDGSSGRMQMYLWNGTPQLDGDVDNGIIVHEYGHGISNKLTGGPANSSCLQNAEQMGEGWSDYYALMFTQNWATATLNTGFNSPRGIGTYALNQAITGLGIRSQKYCTDFTINNKVYLTSLPSSSHSRGEIWCATLWDMTWSIINQVGTINPNIYNVAGGGGNTIAMKLVTEGLKLQQCSPGFISGRNAILQADQNLYGGAYRCTIIAAFAKRGMGTLAAEGSTSSNTDQVVDFSGGGAFVTLTQNGIIAVPEGQNIIYNNKVTSECSALSNYTLRDTLPLNVSFLSATNGGTYNAGTRVVSWPVNLAASSTGNYGFTVNINAGSYFTPLSLIDESVPTTTISGSWATASTTANVWTAHNLRSKSPPNSFFTPDVAIVSDQTIATTNSFALGANPPVLSFWHWYNTESTFDGGVLEISTNGGTSWADIGAANFTQNGYNATISNSYSNPLGSRLAWSGTTGSFVESKVSLAAYANQSNVKLRWRFGSDNSVAATGWNLDDINLTSIAKVNMRSGLFDNTNTRLSYSDTVTIISAPPSVLLTVNLKLFLQGYYIDGGIMQDVMNNQSVPLAQSTSTDSITVELHHPATNALVEMKRALLLSNGLASVQFFQPAGPYYIAIKHRNTIQTWSANPVTCSAATPLYDFSSAANMAMGNNQVQVQTGKWAMYTGDLNQDDFIDGNDFPAFDSDSFNGVNSIYVATDMNGDGFVDGNDFPVFDVNSFNGVSGIHP